MPKPNKKTVPRTTNTSSKRLKNEPDVRNNEVRWDNINYNLISDIFSHLFTIQQLKYRRVSSAWNSMLLDHLSKSTALSLQFSDLKHWKTIIYPPARETRQAVHARKVSLVTERTRRLIIDFASAAIESGNRSSKKIFGLNCNDEYPLAAVGRYHPQICHVVLCRFFEPYCRRYLEYHLSVLDCFSDSMSDLSPNVRITLHEFALQCDQGCYMFTTAERTLIRSWKMPWPKVTFMFVEENFNNVLRERCMKYWPYLPDQLTWLNSCLDNIMLQERPADPVGRPVSRFLGENSVVHAYANFASPTYVTLRGGTYPGFVVALLARFVVTFRGHLNLPPPPHPLIWND